MEKRNVTTNLVAALLVVIAVLGYGLIGKAGNLEPSAAPDSTMKTMQEIYDAVEATQSAVVEEGSSVLQREGFCKTLNVTSGTTPVLTVPAGKRFVLLKLYAYYDVISLSWSLMVNDSTTLFDGNIVRAGSEMVMTWEYIQQFIHDFPDRCVVVDGNDTLNVFNFGGSTLHITIIGYYYDVP